MSWGTHKAVVEWDVKEHCPKPNISKPLNEVVRREPMPDPRENPTPSQFSRFENFLLQREAARPESTLIQQERDDLGTVLPQNLG